MKDFLPPSTLDKKNNLLLCLFTSTSFIIGGCSETLNIESTTMTAPPPAIEKKETNTNAQEEDAPPTPPINDPLEPLNRGIYFINMGIDGIVMKPLALAYRHLLPDPVRSSIGHFYVNINSPVSFANHLLQGQPKRAGNSLIRFAINTTLGILGLFDAAETFGFMPKDTGFGDTLGIWGVNTGPYLMLPALGPCSLRGTVGKIGDFFMQPYNYYFMTTTPDDDWASWTLTGVNLVHQRNLYLESVDELIANSIDPYVTFRSIYFQQEQHQLNELRSKDTK